MQKPVGWKGFVWNARRKLLGFAADLWRPWLGSTRFVAITGSVGKTTAKEIAGQILARHAPTLRTFENANGIRYVASTLLRVRPWHRFAVIEAGLFYANDLLVSGHRIRPDIAVLVSVELEHYHEFRSIEVIAHEKWNLIRTLRPGGIAWVNGDCEHIAAMQAPEGVTLKRFGTAPDLDLRAEDVQSHWPERLSFLVHYQGQSQRMETQLVGTHWLSSVLAAIAVLLDCGFSLQQIAADLREIPPARLRLEAVPMRNGAWVLRDEYKGSRTSTFAAYNALGAARGVRRWLVTSGCDDAPWSRREMMRRLGREVPPVADGAIFIGEHASIAARRCVEDGMNPDQVFAVMTTREASDLVREHCKSGDLILLKAPRNDHLSRIYFANNGTDVRCWREDCRKGIYCDDCPEL